MDAAKAGKSKETGWSVKSYRDWLDITSGIGLIQCSRLASFVDRRFSPESDKAAWTFERLIVMRNDEAHEFRRNRRDAYFLSVPLFVEALNKIVACLHQVELQHQLQDS